MHLNYVTQEAFPFDYKQMQFDGENKLLKKIKSMNAVDHTKQCHLMSNCTILMTVY